jgi:hypothetical protein
VAPEGDGRIVELATLFNDALDALGIDRQQGDCDIVDAGDVPKFWLFLPISVDKGTGVGDVAISLEITTLIGEDALPLPVQIKAALVAATRAALAYVEGLAVPKDPGQE